MLTFIGKQAGDNWEDWKDNLHYVDYAVAAMIVVGVVYLVSVRDRGSRRRRPGRSRVRPEPVARLSRLGALQGPTELLPVSSSGHLALVPRCSAGRYAELDAELRKSFEVALHAGTAVALLIALRDEVVEVLREMDGARLRATRSRSCRRPSRVRAASGRSSERLGQRGGGRGRAGGRRGLAARAGRPARRRGASARGRRLGDALLIGLGQACALVPGVSRNGATLDRRAAARLRAARGRNRLSRHAALPIIVGAAALKGVRLARGAAADARRRSRRAPRGVRLDASLPRRLVPRVDRARSYRAVRRLPGRARGRRPIRFEWARHELTRRLRRAGVDTTPADAGVAALVGVLRTIDTGTPVARRPGLGPLRQRPAASPETSASRCRTDGVGSKVIVAEQLGRFDTVGIDCIAMNVNDVICVGRRAARRARLHRRRAGRPRAAAPDRASA